VIERARPAVIAASLRAVGVRGAGDAGGSHCVHGTRWTSKCFTGLAGQTTAGRPEALAIANANFPAPTDATRRSL
jgi:hypothetical protein